MVNGDKIFLLDKLSEVHAALQSVIAGIDLELRVYSDTDWRVRDILGHIATWDQEVTKSLRAFLGGSEYVIPVLDEDESDFNEQAVVEQRKLSTEQIVAEWKQAREDLKTALRDIPAEMFPGDLLFPWGDERGSIAKLVGYMIEHDEEHKGELVKFIQTLREE
jgi:hypothetical protein